MPCGALFREKMVQLMARDTSFFDLCNEFILIKVTVCHIRLIVKVNVITCLTISTAAAMQNESEPVLGASYGTDHKILDGER